MRCAEVMRPATAADCCLPRDSVRRAAEIMKASGEGCAPVIEDRAGRRLVGVVSERDVCCGVVAEDRPPAQTPVSEVMQPASGSCCHTDEDARVAEATMRRRRMTALPVVDDGGCCCGTVRLSEVAG